MDNPMSVRWGSAHQLRSTVLRLSPGLRQIPQQLRKKVRTSGDGGRVVRWLDVIGGTARYEDVRDIAYLVAVGGVSVEPPDSLAPIRATLLKSLLERDTVLRSLGLGGILGSVVEVLQSVAGPIRGRSRQQPAIDAGLDFVWELSVAGAARVLQLNGKALNVRQHGRKPHFVRASSTMGRLLLSLARGERVRRTVRNTSMVSKLSRALRDASADNVIVEGGRGGYLSLSRSLRVRVRAASPRM